MKGSAAIGALAVGFVLLLVIIVLAPVALFPSVFAADAHGSTARAASGSGPIPADLVAVFDEAGRVFDVNPYLLASVAEQESDFGSPASRHVNSAGCVGFMQTCVGGRGGDSWDSTVTLTSHPNLTLAQRFAYKLGNRPAGYQGQSQSHPDFNDPFDAVMAGAVELRGKVGGVPIPNLDNTAYRALCGYYGACADPSVNYAHEVFSRAQQWQGENLLSPAGPVSPGRYVNPMGQVAHLTGERVDEGVDYAGSGPLLAVGDGTVQLAASSGVGWPRWNAKDGLGGFVGYQLTDGPYKGKEVYVAENIDPLVAKGQTVTAGQPIATLHFGGAGLETGWWAGNGSASLALSLGQQAPGKDPGAWTAAAGASFNRLLIALGAPSGVLQPGGEHGTMPSGYP